MPRLPFFNVQAFLWERMDANPIPYLAGSSRKALPDMLAQ